MEGIFDKEVYEFFSDYMRKLFDACPNFRKYLDNGDEYGNWDLEQFDDICVKGGETKMVFIMDGNANDDVKALQMKERYVLKFNEDDSFDWCYAECYNYQKALEYGVDELLAAIDSCEIEYEGKTYTFYIQERVYGDEEINWEVIEGYGEDLRRCGEDVHHTGSTETGSWYSYRSGSDCYEVFDSVLRHEVDEKIAARFQAFVEAEVLNDLHTGNYCITDTGLLIFDYSGYGSRVVEKFEALRKIQ